MVSAIAGADADDALHVGEAFDLLAVDGEDDVARLEAGGCRSAPRLHGIDAGAGRLLADDHENGGENHDRQNEIGDRPGRHHRGAGGDRLVDEAVLLFGLGHRRGGLVVGHARGVVVAEEFHVAAERHRGDFPARAVAVVEADDLGAEADGKGEHADAAPARHQEVAELVKEHDNGEDEQEGNDITGDAAAEGAQTPHNVRTHHTLVPARLLRPN